MKRHELSVFLIVGVVLVIAVALMYFSGGKVGAATATVENVKCVFKNSQAEQKCYLAGGPVIVITPPNKVCYGVNECKLKVKSQPGAIAKWKSSCSEEVFKTVVDGKNDVIEFMCPTPITFYAEPSSVYYEHGFTVYWDATNVGADSCSGWGSHVPLDAASGSWTDQVNLEPRGTVGLIGKHGTLGFATPLWLGIQCWKKDVGEVGRAQIKVDLIHPGLLVTTEKNQYNVGEPVKVDIKVASSGVTVNHLWVYVQKIEPEVPVQPSEKTLVASYEGFISTTLTVPTTFIPTTGAYVIMTCIDENCNQRVFIGLPVV